MLSLHSDGRNEIMPTQLRTLLTSPDLSFLMEAHNGLSAKIVAEAGFEAIWASGLTIAASLGVRDANEASWTQVVDVVEFMVDAVDIPILVDGDSGFGNFNNVRRLVRKLCERRVAGVCLEDKLFPKTNSFHPGRQDLAPQEEFIGKLKAAKDSQLDQDFCVVARTEALIAGHDLQEALERAEAYRGVGADAVLVHSKQPDPDEILAFAKAWAHRGPLVIIPTTYAASTSTDTFRQAGVTAVIWANHTLRASIAAMRRVSRQLFEEQSIGTIEPDIVSVQDVLDLVNTNELTEAERLYGPQRGLQTRK